MAGALTERAFVQQMHKTGFVDVAVQERETYGVDLLASEPLFPADLIELMRRLIPPDVAERIGVRLLISARKPPSVQ